MAHSLLGKRLSSANDDDDDSWEYDQVESKYPLNIPPESKRSEAPEDQTTAKIFRYYHLLDPKGDGNYADDVDAEFTRYKALGDDVGKGLSAVEVWSDISQIKLIKKLSEVALLVLVIPHSNAGEERVFSQVKKIWETNDRAVTLRKH